MCFHSLTSLREQDPIRYPTEKKISLNKEHSLKSSYENFLLYMNSPSMLTRHAQESEDVVHVP